MQTIFAQATARGKAGVAIIRVSGSESFEIGQVLVGDLPAPGVAALRSIRRGQDLLDQGLVLTFRGPKSFTGEDVVEFHLHGSVAIIQAVEQTILDTGLARFAEPGEFTQRALMNQTLDLSQVEGLSDLIDAETEAQRRQAMRVFSGGLSKRTEHWRNDLVRSASLLELSIDFVDEDVPVDVMPEVLGLLENLRKDLGAEINGSKVAERVRDGFEVAILGAPNAGKSTLINALAGRSLAITSDVPGTTRDVIEARLDIRGLPVTFLDMAGIRQTTDKVEKLGVGLAVSRALDADLRILLETEDWPGHDALDGEISLTYRAKADLHGSGVSGLTGQGIDQLLDDVEGLLSKMVSQVRVAISERQRGALTAAEEHVSISLEMGKSQVPVEVIAEELRRAIRALDSLIGRVDVEHLLGEIFSRFCIGK